MNKKAKKQLQETMEEIERLLKSDNLSGATEVYTDFVIDNAWILDFATMEETFLYGLISGLTEEELQSVLKEIVEKTDYSLTKEEKEDTMKLSAEALQMTIIRRWLERVSKKE